MHRLVTKIAAGAVWLSGSVFLALKGGDLLAEALAMRPERAWTWAVVPAGLLIGAIKSVFIFEKVCRKNLDRIAALERPRIWHAFRWGFYPALAAMIFCGAMLSRLASGNYPGLVATAVLDFSLATALLASARLFLTHR